MYLLYFIVFISGTVLVQANEPTIHIDIPEEPLAMALRQFADQTGLQLAIETSLATGKTSAAIKGEFSARAALDTLLQGTGLRYEFLDSGTVAVVPVDKARKSELTSHVSPEIHPAQAGQGGAAAV